MLAVSMFALLLGGCTSVISQPPAASGAEVTLTVSAASSLTEAFTDIANVFERAHPGVRVSLNFGGSGALAEQVNSGAPVDVIALASIAAMSAVTDAGHASAPTTFARNTLAVVVPAGNPAGIRTLTDLSMADVRVALCAADVPCGAAAETMLAGAQVKVTPVTLDPDVKTVLARVAADEVDAGIVYVTDAIAGRADVEQIHISASQNSSIDYEIAQVMDAGEPGLAGAFVDLVLSAAGQQALAGRGFTSP